jgi:hypothetical protein
VPVSWHCSIEPALSISIRNGILSESVGLLRALLPRVMTANKARHGRILLPIKCSCSAESAHCQWHAYNQGSIPTPDPQFAGDDRGIRVIPIPGSHRGFRALSYFASHGGMLL